ncbi:EAL domain-containing protein [Vallicoccus soli]|uniref:EAL domain-containing protein n=1 Tax=Vallicoccus soli TaxID=2339232 RepID=A0A3A3YYF3_9ACTN|nr:EAL domain-containing protein [Vallicoccus soli]RJK95334.1 EAL domain-containing protein [Vallicoccus soli]
MALPLRVVLLSPPLAGVVGYLWTVPGSLAQALLYLVVVAWAMAVAAVGVLRNRPARSRIWWALLAGMGLWFLGDSAWTYLVFVGGREPFPSLADAVFLPGYVALALGMYWLVRGRRPGRDRAALLDASVVATGVGVLAGVFVLLPLAVDDELALLGKLVASAYPLGDLLVLAMLVRLASTPGASTPAFRLLAGSFTASLVADAAYNVVVYVNGGSTTPPWVDASWLLGYVLFAAAAADPSMRTLSEPAPEREEVLTRRRLLALALACALAPVTALVQAGLGQAPEVVITSVGSLVLSALVLTRMAGLLERVRAQAVQLAALAAVDGLTGVANRRTLDLEISRACARARAAGQPLAVALLDLDRFKAYNDRHGHRAGDRLLKEAAAAWQEVLGPDDLLARYGGEEFAVLLPGRDGEAARRVLDRARALTPDGQSFSAGVVVWDGAEEPGDALGRADEALYAAKRGGRDQVRVWGAQPGARTVATAVVVQPLVDLRTGAVVAHEALARFPGEPDVAAVFARAQEQGTGPVLEASALAAALALPGRPAGTLLHVNVSVHALAEPVVLQALPAELAGVVVELTEAGRLGDHAALGPVLADLRRRGALVALDDVGSGAADLRRLVDLRPDVVKVDRALVAGVHADAARRALLGALVTCAHELGMVVCAEGVEEDADLRALAALGVDQAQGWLLGRPGPRWAGRAAAGAPAAVAGAPA